MHVCALCRVWRGCWRPLLDTIRIYDWASIKTIRTHLWCPPRHSATVPSVRTVSYFYQWQVLLTICHCSSTRTIIQYLGWLILRSAQADRILEKFPNFWNSKWNLKCVLLISKSEYWRVKNVNSWKISVGDSWIVDIYGNLKTFDGWWLKVKATLSGAVEILWNITKLLRIILTIKPKIWLTNESPEMYLTI